jgi:precorrin-3B C17-methyltransferase
VTGWLRVGGIGPGPSHWITPEVSAALAAASDIVGYRSYLSRLAVQAGQNLHGSDNREELSRAQRALALAADGARVLVVSGGDPGVFAMASAVFEAIEFGPPAWRALDVAVLPGVTAMLAAAARLGAPLGSDFCAINLSDNLKPWALIEQRLACAAQADFVIALYNPASRARTEQLQQAFALLRRLRAPQTLVMFASAVGRADESIRIQPLADADPRLADMRSLVLIGASGTRCIERAGQPPFIYSPRRALEAS